jgi:hypothetical protein
MELEKENKKMRKFLLALAAAGTLGLAVSAAPAQAAPAIGLTAPAVESNTVNARCHHHRRSSRWHCYRRHHHYAPQHYYVPRHHYRHHRHWH